MDSSHEEHHIPRFLLPHGRDRRSYVRQRFVPDILSEITDGSPDETTTVISVFTFGVGVQWFEAYEAAKQKNRVLVGGISPRGTISAAGGWLQGGGHSAMSPNYGLGMQNPHSVIKWCSHHRFVGVDNVLEFTIVTADGSHVIANAYNNQDLFWALRGGGGGTWGVVTSASYKTHPSIPLSGAILNVNSTNPDSTRKLLAEIIHLTPSLVEHGYGGYSGGSTDTFGLSVLSPNVTTEQTDTTFLPLFEFAHSQPGLSVENHTILYPDFWAFLEQFANGDAVGEPVEISSWLLPEDVIKTDKPEDLAAELMKLPGFGYL